MTVSSLPKPVIYVVGLVALVMMALLITDKTGALKLLSRKNQVRISTKPSADILFLTQPVTSISGGKIEKIEGNSIFVTQQYSYQQLQAALPSPGQPPVFPTPITKKITYKILITDKTNISRPRPNIPYLLKIITPVPEPKLSVKDLRVGDLISNISTNNVDLRTLEKPEFEASFASLYPITNSISGKITKNTGNTIIVKAMPPQSLGPIERTPDQAAPQEKEYTVTIDEDTEISRYGRIPSIPSKEDAAKIAEPAKPEKIEIEQLTPETSVNVYTDVDLSTHFQVKALRIEPQQLASEIPTPMPLPEVQAPPPVVIQTTTQPATEVKPTSVPTTAPTTLPTKAPTTQPSE